MKIKSTAFIYENMDTNLLQMEKDSSRLLRELAEEESEIIDIKVCLNNDGYALFTIIYEYEIKD